VWPRNRLDDLLSEQDKSRLLDYLRKAHGQTDAKTKITLTRKETTEIRQQDSHGKSHTVQVEVRKKRVLVKREAPEVRAELPVPPVLPITVTEKVVEARSAPPVEVKTEKIEPLVAVKAEPVVEARVKKSVPPVDREGRTGGREG
jgi:translation initiation factor IF-2